MSIIDSKQRIATKCEENAIHIDYSQSHTGI